MACTMTTSSVSGLIFLSILVFSSCYQLVEVEEGVLSGTYYSTTSGRIINAFLGVPYAAPPVGKYRFLPPQRLQPWKGTWNASIHGSRCLQYSHGGYEIKGEEDCLFLNIYTPKVPQQDDHVDTLMDVIVYIHGGCFMFGTGNVKYPDYLLDKNDIVYVSINYRVGPIGFFSTGDEVVPGNNGLKDQVAALQWIQRNIAKFGGNPNSVTISGMSAGGASIHYHYFSPLSEGLFHRGISESGSMLIPWTLPREVPAKCRTIADHMGCPTGNLREMIKCLEERPALQILERVKELMPWRYNPYSPVGPVVEPNISGAFLPEKPIDTILRGGIRNLPWLISTTEHEGLYPAADFIPYEDAIKELNDRWDEIAPHLLDYNYTVPLRKQKEVNNVIRERYFGSKPISKDTIPQLVYMLGDRLFTAYAEHVAKLQAASNTEPVYYYKFDYRGKYSLSNFYANNFENYGVSHGDDMAYVLRVFWSNSNETESDRKMIDLMVRMWASFAKTGKPDIGMSWKPVPRNLEDFHYLYIGSADDLQLLSNKNASDLFHFWTGVLGEFKQESVHDEL